MALAVRTKPDPRPAAWEWALVANALLLAVMIRWLWIGFDLDDSYITYTYGRSLAQGEGFVFAGQKALGTTTPLYALILGACHFVGLPMVESAKFIGLLSSLAACLLIWLLARSVLGRWPALAAAGLLALNARHASVSMCGMETSLYLAVCLGALCAFRWERPYWTASLSAAACLLRPDGLLLAVVLAAAHVGWRRKLQRGPVFCFLVPLLLWNAYAWLEFGSPVPTSLTAKLSYSDYGPFRLETAAAVLGTPLLPFALALTLMGLVYTVAHARGLVPIALWTLLYLAAFLRAPNFPWYYVPPIPGIILLALAGFVGLVKTLVPGKTETRRAFRFGVSAAAAVGVGWFGPRDTLDYRDWLSRYYGPDVTGAYRSLAEWFRANTPEGATVGVPEVGYVGFYSERRVLDLVGLCSPQVIPYLPGRRYVEIVRDFKPDYVALTTEVGRPVHSAIMESEWFRTHYTGCIRIPYRGRSYIIWRRLSRPLSTPPGPPPT